MTAIPGEKRHSMNTAKQQGPPELPIPFQRFVVKDEMDCRPPPKRDARIPDAARFDERRRKGKSSD